ncbi:MAG: hypothetical protein AAFY63_22765 [Cyanobacteria bacterium J06643_13]
MSTLVVWECLSVAEFVARCNWENAPSPTTVKSPIQTAKALAEWQCLTAADFFALSNWSGQTLRENGLISSDRAKAVFDLTSANAQFWQCFNWSGIKSSVEPQQAEQILKQTEEAIAEVEEFSLNDLSQLF